MRIIGRTIISSIIVASMAAASPSFGHVRPPLPGDVSVEIVSDKGSLFQSFPHSDIAHGLTRTTKKFLEAKKGEQYAIVVRNNSPERLGLVIAVDGRNVISGGMSNLNSTESMYVVNPYEQARYDGWRTTENEVHRFYFTEPADSYSVRTFGDSSAMGVISVAVFREKKPPMLRQQNSGRLAPAAPSLESAARSDGKSEAEDRAGTGFGDAQYSPVVQVEFKPESMPVRKTLVKYEWRETLCRKGILNCGQEKRNRLWDQDGYAPYPPGYPRS